MAKILSMTSYLHLVLFKINLGDNAIHTSQQGKLKEAQRKGGHSCRTELGVK